MKQPQLGPSHQQLLDQFQKKEGVAYFDEDNGNYLAENGTRLRINNDGSWMAIAPPSTDLDTMRKLGLRWRQLEINAAIDERDSYRSQLIYNARTSLRHPNEDERKTLRELIQKVKALNEAYYQDFEKPVQDAQAEKQRSDAKIEARKNEAVAAVHEITED